MRTLVFGLMGVVAAVVLALLLMAEERPRATPVGALLKGQAAIVVDGDTFDLVTLKDGSPSWRRVRLWGVDSPERGEEGYRLSAAWLALLLAEKGGAVSCKISPARHQKAGRRVVAACWAGEARNVYESVNCRMLEEGAATEMKRYSEGALSSCLVGL